MKIYCPKCHTCYSIETGLIPIGGKKFRCVNCGEVWNCTHKDLHANEDDSNDFPLVDNEINETPSPTTDEEKPTEETESSEPQVTEDELQQIFARLQTETQKINTEVASQTAIQKNLPKIKKVLGWDSRLTIMIEFFIITLIICLSIFANRYDIVRQFPQTELIFQTLGIEARIIGEGLEFQNITRAYENPNEPNSLSIKGFIYNSTSQKLDIPTILVKIMDSDTNLLQETTAKANISTLTAQDKHSFNITVDVSPQKAKYILLTFTK